jgi:hypothetical protein
MSTLRRTLALGLALLTTAAMAALPDAPAEKLDAWRKNPQAYARLRQNARAFLALPPERQERLRRLDEDLHKQPSSTQKHLFDVLARYADWLERLPEADRRTVLEAPDREARLQAIKELRDEQWLQRQARAVRNRLAPLRPARPALRVAGAARPALSPSPGAALAFAAAPFTALGNDPRSFVIGKLRQEERRRRQEWRLALRHWDELKDGRVVPSRLADFGGLIENYVKEYLYPRLSPADRERLEKAEGQWPLYPYTLVELADRHPPALPTAKGPTRVEELPVELQTRLKKWQPKGAKALKGPTFANSPKVKAGEGKWPAYAVAISFFAGRRNIHMPNELWPSHHRDLSPGVQEFLDKKLRPRLDEAEKNLLKEKEGRWPDYPLMIQELARRHYFEVPWQTLPGRRENWDVYRLKRPTSAAGFPELPRQTLRDFALAELTPQERAALKLSTADPTVWGRLTEEYFRRKPHEEKRLRQQDAQHRQRRDGGAFLKTPPQRPGPGRQPEF